MADETTPDEPPHVEGIAKFWKETEDGKREEIDTTTEMADIYKQARTSPSISELHASRKHGGRI